MVFFNRVGVFLRGVVEVQSKNFRIVIIDHLFEAIEFLKQKK
jgi:hypothetical protein